MTKIAFDAGHGLKTAGKQTPTGIKEWTLNDKVRDKVVALLKDYDCSILHTDNDEGNTDESMKDRVNKYLSAGVDVFVSLHHNAFKGTFTDVTGVEVYVDNNATAEDLRLAECIYGRLVKYTGLKGRGIKRADFAVINQNKIPAVLIEGGFMDGAEDYKVITTDAGQNAYAKAVADGLIEYFNLKKKTISNKTGEVQKSMVINGFNVHRAADSLVIYDKGTSTGTNKWGTEVALDANGVAISNPVYGIGNMQIPAGGCVLSGHGKQSNWILNNIKKGARVTVRVTVD